MDSSNSYDDMVYCRNCHAYHRKVSGGLEHFTRNSICDNEFTEYTTKTFLDTNTQEG